MAADNDDPPSSDNAFGDFLKAHRESQGISQEKLANDARMSKDGIYKLEKGKRKPRKETVEWLARALSLSDEQIQAFLTIAGFDYNPSDDDSRFRPPAPISSYIPRGDQETEMLEALRDRDCRLLTLTGPAGCGKTRLAQVLATQITPEFAGRVYWIQLAAIKKDESALPKLVAQAVKVPNGLSTKNDIVKRLDQMGEVLLVLDNCEDLRAACSRLAKGLAERCSSLKILATSQWLLDVNGEIVWPVDPLSLPESLSTGQPVTQEEWLQPVTQEVLLNLKSSQAIQLFEARARTVKRGFQLTEQNVGAVAYICWKLAGLPLAIELVAGWLPSFMPHEIARELDDILKERRTSNGTSRSTHTSLPEAMEASYLLLNSSEKAVLRWCSVFADTWDRAAVKALNADLKARHVENGTEEIDILACLKGLVEKSMVQSVQVQSRVRGHTRPNITITRYRLLETVRGFAREKLKASDEQNAVKVALLRWFVTLTKGAPNRLAGPDQVKILNQLDLENENLFALLDWVWEAGADQEHAVELGLQIAADLTPFWENRGHVKRGWKCLEALLRIGSGVPPAVRAHAGNQAGQLAYLMDDLDTADAHFQTSQSLFRELGDASGQAEALNGLANVAGDRSDDNSGWDQLYQECLKLYRQAGDKVGEADILHNQGVGAYWDGNDEQAEILFGEALAICKERQDACGAAFTLSALAPVVLRQKNYEKAEAYLREGLTSAAEYHYKRVIPLLIEGYAQLAVAREQYRCAARLLGAASNLRDETGVTMDLQEKKGHEQAMRALLDPSSAASREDVTLDFASGRKMPLDQIVEYALSLRL